MTNGLCKFFVLDLTVGRSGAVCSEYLALAGMDVVRVERPCEPDRGERAEHIAFNLNKKCITLDENTPEGANILRRLAAKADVIVENRRGALKELALDYESVKKTNPGVVYISIPPYASDSPWADYPADRSVISAMSGATYLCGNTGCDPLEPGGDLPDVASSLYAATATASALWKREESGEGAFIEVNQMDSVISLGRAAYEQYYMTKSNIRCGNQLLGRSPTDLFETSDGYVAIMCVGERHFPPLCEAIGQPELANDPRFRTQADRVAHRAEINAIISEWTRKRTKFEVMKILLLQYRAICCAVYTLEDIINAEDLRDMKFIQRVYDEVLGEMWLPVFPGVCEAFNPVAEAPKSVSLSELGKEERYGL